VSITGAETDPTRRSFLDWIIWFCGAVVSVAVVVPALAYLWPITKAGPVKSREKVGGADSWSLWQGKKVQVADKPVLVIRTDKGFLAYSAVCTHLGCLVEFDAAKRDIHCPCHAARFDLQGRVTAGPPPRPLSGYTASVVDGQVYVSL